MNRYRANTYSITLENVMTTAVVVIIVRSLRLIVISRQLANFREVRNVVRAPESLVIIT